MKSELFTIQSVSDRNHHSIDSQTFSPANSVGHLARGQWAVRDRPTGPSCRVGAHTSFWVFGFRRTKFGDKLRDFRKSFTAGHDPVTQFIQAALSPPALSDLRVLTINSSSNG